MKFILMIVIMIAIMREMMIMIMTMKPDHTSASLGLPQTWSSTKMARPDLDPVLRQQKI